MRLPLWLLGALLLLACERPQWLVVIATDAQVPQFGDYLLLEVVDAAHAVCPSCRRLQGVDQANRWPVSFGITPPSTAAPLLVRARLLRADHLGADPLVARPTIEGLWRLSAAAPVGVTTLGAVLSMRCYGVPAELESGQSCDPATGRLAAALPLSEIKEETELPRPASWEPGLPRACPQGADLEGGRVRCIPGGTFLLGGNAEGDEQALATWPEHLVALSPFWLDRDEFTVADYLRLRDSEKVLLPTPVGWIEAKQDRRFECNFNNPERQQHPLNCISRADAESICAARFMRLPTEAEWEYVAGGRDREAVYAADAAGESDSVCDFAWVARDRPQSEMGSGLATDCRSAKEGYVWGTAVPGRSRDVTVDGIRDLGGNVAEWVEDRFAGYGDPGWNPGKTLLEDPLCCTPRGCDQRRGQPWCYDQAGVVRGGSWSSARSSARVNRRDYVQGGAWSPQVGFRCARSVDTQARPRCP